MELEISERYYTVWPTEVVLTTITTEQTKDIIKNHLIEEKPKLENQLLDRAMLAREARVIPYEAVVRGYLTGSAWNEYQSNQTTQF